jgi:hydrogenase expression/formation protein HypE
MNKDNQTIMMSHGNGGQMMHDLIGNLFLKWFDNPLLRNMSDATFIPAGNSEIAFTTDSFVVDPLFFPGGDIGKLSVCGTVNDLAVSGADPRYISVAMILEEGLSMEILEKIVKSLAAEAHDTGVMIVTGDTKVVPRGKCDKIFINTAGIGYRYENKADSEDKKAIRPGDQILINGTIGDHGMAVMSMRESFSFRSDIRSDCASLHRMIRRITSQCHGVRFMRDPTRGGVATVLSEIVENKDFGIFLDEDKLPVTPSVFALTEILGMDPLHVANEGKVIVVIDPAEADLALELMRSDLLGRDASIIGTVTGDFPGKVLLNTKTGGRRFIGKLVGDPLPRIC